MKVIIISDVLPEPFELDSARDHGLIGFHYLVSEKVEAVLQVEQMQETKEEHGLFGRKS